MWKNTAVEIFGFLLITLAIIFYLGWAIKYNAWFDVGLFSFVTPILIFGILGVILARLNEKGVQ
ncbi:MAG: hypothetical protein RXP30_01880 [Thermoplasmata archaeon]|jgi:hypothetical protein|nr:hypothetical protein [Thermoplasmata archaeon]MVT13483.1 hypothetical protein [Euryarchaeota archaeon]MVT15085.1 hypothetical protein [Euryarchaeota archaeon]MVT35525.1 hypothetical protein [Euryarchaeota archaeon]